jgi:hypothetical protein
MLNGAEEKSPLTRGGIKLACAIIGKINTEAGWTVKSETASNRRLKSAGIDPKTFQVVDERAAGWAWYQLRTTRKYKEAVQRELMNSADNPPDINIPLVFADKKTMDEIKSQNIQTPELKPFTTLDKRLNGIFD